MRLKVFGYTKRSNGAKLDMTDIGEIVIDISLDTTGDTLYAPSGQIFKTLVFGVGYDGNNTAMQLYQASPELQYDIVKRSTSLGGNVTGSFIGDYAVGSVANNNPYYFDDSLGIRLEGASSGIVNNVTYMRVQ